MPILNDKQKIISEGINDQIRRQSTKVVLESYLSSMTNDCMPICINNKQLHISKTQKQCLLNCFRKKNMAVKSYMKNLVKQSD